jgi:hypothetical protein
MRHWTLLLVGFVAAVLLAGLSYYRVTFDGLPPELTPRKAELWQSQATVFFTEAGFPVGRRTIPFDTKVVAGERVAVPRYNPPGSYTGLASLYARLAESDQVKQLIEKDGPLRGRFQAAQTLDSSGDPLPMVSLFGKAGTAANAEATVTRGLEGFVAYLTAQQQAAGIPENERVELRVVNAPGAAVLVEPRKRTLPVVVLLSVLIAAIATAFVRENARSERQSIALVDEPEDAAEKLPAPMPTPGPARSPLPEPEPDEPEPVPVRRWA